MNDGLWVVLGFVALLFILFLVYRAVTEWEVLDNAGAVSASANGPATCRRDRRRGGIPDDTESTRRALIAVAAVLGSAPFARGWARGICN